MYVSMSYVSNVPGKLSAICSVSLTKGSASVRPKAAFSAAVCRGIAEAASIRAMSHAASERWSRIHVGGRVAGWGRYVCSGDRNIASCRQST